MQRRKRRCTDGPRPSTRRRGRLIVCFVASVVLLVAGSARAQWGGSSIFGFQEEKVRLSLYGGWFRISHSNFEDYYRSRWGTAPGALLRVRVKGIRVLTGVRRFRQKLKSQLASSFPDLGSRAWEQTVWNLGISFGSGQRGRLRSATYFGLCYHQVYERAQPYITDAPKSTTLGFFILLEGEYMLLPRAGIGWMVELSSAASGRAAAFEANSIGGFYIGAALHLHLF